MTDGWTRKLILLCGYDEMAAGFKDLNLPIFSVPDLFMRQKIVNDRPAQSVRRSSVPSNVHNSAERSHSESVHHSTMDVNGQARQCSSPSPPSYTSAVQRARSPPAMTATPTLNASEHGMAAFAETDDGWKVKSKISVPKKDGNKRSIIHIVCLLPFLLTPISQPSL